MRGGNGSDLRAIGICSDCVERSAKAMGILRQFSVDSKDFGDSKLQSFSECGD